LRKSVGETIDRVELISAEYAVQLDAMLTPSESHLDRGQSLMLEAQNLLPLLDWQSTGLTETTRPNTVAQPMFHLRKPYAA
jgi:hypothetical protein